MKEELPIGQGTGVEGRYGGLPDPYGKESFAQVFVLPIPFDKTTTYQKGSDKGPKALIEASRNMELYDVETSSEPYLEGIYTAPAVIAESSEEMLQLAYDRAKNYYEQGKFVAALGGEHSVSFAPIKAAVETFGNLNVIQFDAHLDLQPSYEGNPYSHASVMARVKELPGIESLIAIGIRSMAKEELPSVSQPHTFFGHEMEEAENRLQAAIEKITGPVYITFDLDAFDCSLMPSTGTPEPGGLMWNQACRILKYIFREKTVVGVDIVELLPRATNPAPDFLAAKLLYKMLSYRGFYKK